MYFKLYKENKNRESINKIMSYFIEKETLKFIFLIIKIFSFKYKQLPF